MLFRVQINNYYNRGHEKLFYKMAASRDSGRLLHRLRKVIQSWPEDSSRSGRDLGGHLKRVLLPKYESGAAEVRRLWSMISREHCS